MESRERPERKIIPLNEERQRRKKGDAMPQVTQSYDITAEHILAESTWRKRSYFEPEELATINSAMANARLTSEAEILEKLRIAQLDKAAFDDPYIFAAAQEYITRRARQI